MISSGRQILTSTALVAAAATVLMAWVTAKDADVLPRQNVPARAARLAATSETFVVALSLVVLSYQPVAATLQSVPLSGRLLSEPGDLLRQWLLLGAWAGPAGAPVGHWLLYRVGDVLLLAVVWWSLRWLPALLTRTTVPAMAVGTVCATVIGLLASQLLQIVTSASDSGMRRGLVHLSASIGGGVPAALTCGLVAGVAAVVTLRSTAGRTETTDAMVPAPPAALPDQPA
ncbi:hypothetical protein [Streptomyces sp. NPDC002540]